MRATGRAAKALKEAEAQEALDAEARVCTAEDAAHAEARSTAYKNWRLDNAQPEHR